MVSNSNSLFVAKLYYTKTMSIAASRMKRASRGLRVAVWVATTGSDSNPGTQAAPLATIVAARNKVRSIIAAGRPVGGIAVNVMPGTYPQSAMVDFVAGDSGTVASPVIWRAVGGPVTLTGSVAIPPSAYQTVPPAMATLFPSSIRSQVRMVDLAVLGVDTPVETQDRDSWTATGATIVVDGAALTLARYPNNGWLSVQAGSTASDMNSPVVLKTTDATVLSWAGATGDARLCAEIVYQWASQIMNVTSIDAGAGTITAQAHSNWGVGTPDTSIGRYYIFNLPQALDSPNEYYIDTANRKAYFVPGTTASVTTINTTIIHCYYTSYLTFDGIGVAEGRFHGYTISGSSHITLRNLTAAHLNAGIMLNDATDTLLDNVTVHDIGTVGVSLSGGDRPTLMPGNNTLQYSRVYDCSLRVPNYNPAVDINGVGAKVLHNNIYNSPHALIILRGNDHLIQDNWIHHGVLDNSDAGAFYCGRDWTERGNVLNRNWFSDIGTPDHRFTVAIYYDDCESGFVATNNILVDTWYGLHHCGRDNFFDNNVIVRAQGMAWHVGNWGSGPDNQATLTQRYNDMINTPTYQAAAWAKYPHFATILSDEPNVPKYNTVSNCLIVDSVPGAADNYPVYPQVTVSGLQTLTAAQLGLDTTTHMAAADSIVTNGSGTFKRIDISRIYHP